MTVRLIPFKASVPKQPDQQRGGGGQDKTRCQLSLVLKHSIWVLVLVLFSLVSQQLQGLQYVVVKYSQAENEAVRPELPADDSVVARGAEVIIDPSSASPPDDDTTLRTLPPTDNKDDEEEDSTIVGSNETEDDSDDDTEKSKGVDPDDVDFDGVMPEGSNNLSATDSANNNNELIVAEESSDEYRDLMDVESKLVRTNQQLRFLFLVTLDSHRHAGMFQWILRNRTDVRLLLLSTEQEVVDRNPHIRFLKNRNWKVFYENIGIRHKDFDWFLRCPSNVHVDLDRLQQYLQQTYPNSARVPLYLGFRYDKAAKLNYFDGDTMCQLWNSATARKMVRLRDCKRYDEHSRGLGECLGQNRNITLTFLETPKRHSTPCEIQKHTTQWMFPKLFDKRFLRFSIAQWLALTHPYTFIPQNQCNCTHSKIAHRIQWCGVRKFTKMIGRTKCQLKLQRCPINSKNTLPMPTKMIHTHVISLHPNTTQGRIDNYLPKPTFEGRVLNGIRVVGNGVYGYRQSMEKALTTGLQTDAEVIAVFDEDFRVAKDFEARWKTLISSGTCYHNTLSNNGVFMLGTTIWDKRYWESFDRYPREQIRDNGLCFDGNQFFRGSFANLFSRNAAKVALDWMKVTPPSRPFDWFWMDLVDLGFPVRGAVSPLIVSDVEHASTVDIHRSSGEQYRDVELRHELHRWGPVDAYVPASGDTG